MAKNDGASLFTFSQTPGPTQGGDPQSRKRRYEECMARGYFGTGTVCMYACMHVPFWLGAILAQAL